MTGRASVDALRDQLARETKGHAKALERVEELRTQIRLTAAEARHRQACIADLSAAIDQLTDGEVAS